MSHFFGRLATPTEEEAVLCRMNLVSLENLNQCFAFGGGRQRNITDTVDNEKGSP